MIHTLKVVVVSVGIFITGLFGHKSVTPEIKPSSLAQNIEPQNTPSQGVPPVIQKTQQDAPAKSAVVYLTHDQIADQIDQIHLNIENTINASPAQIEINQLTEQIKNLQIEEDQNVPQCIGYSACEESLDQIEADLKRPQSSSNMDGEEQVYQLKLQEEQQNQQIEEQIQRDNQSVESDQNEITSYRNTQKSKFESLCATSDNIDSADVTFCQSLL